MRIFFNVYKQSVNVPQRETDSVNYGKNCRTLYIQ